MLSNKCNKNALLIILLCFLPVNSFARNSTLDAHHNQDVGKQITELQSVQKTLTSLQLSVKTSEELQLNLTKQVESLNKANNELQGKIQGLEKDINDNTSNFAFVLSVVNFILTILYYRERSRYATLANLAPIVSVERSLGEEGLEDAFSKFHGINEDEIDSAGVTRKELAYLVSNFTAGRIYDVGKYRWQRNKAFEDTNYRYKMLRQASTRRAWPLILKMMTSDHYIKQLQLTFDEIERKETSRAHYS
jgi:hypothetical protein